MSDVRPCGREAPRSPARGLSFLGFSDPFSGDWSLLKIRVAPVGGSRARDLIALYQSATRKFVDHARMATFVFKCPNMGLNVQGFVADDPSEEDNHSYRTITCLACRQIHLVNPKTGGVLIVGDE